MKSVLSISLLVCLLSKWIQADSCTDSCDALYASEGPVVTLCGTDALTHTTTWGALDSKCYFNCNVNTYYAGACGCPNDCSVKKGQGQCVEGAGSRSCQCASGYRGDDCSLPSCPDNACSGHGKCIPAANNDYGVDYCQCVVGFTSTDCSLTVNRLDKLPWGELSGDEYSGNDQYKDTNPLFNLTVMASIYITVSEEDYRYLLLPVNAENQSYVPANVSIENNEAGIHTTLTHVGFRIKGSSTRKDQKKGFSVSFDEFVPAQTLYGMKKIGLKTGFEDGSPDAFVKGMLYIDMARSVGVPVYRGSFSRLYVNQIFVGLYMLHEDVGKVFFASRFDEDSGKGDFYKFNRVHLEYYGSDATYYQTAGDGNSYQQIQGADWTPFVNLLQFFNESSAADFEKNVEDFVGVKNLLNLMMVESFLISGDNMCHGNNYGLYRRTKSSKETQWQLIEQDFDRSFYYFYDDNGVLTYKEPYDIATFWSDRNGTWPNVNILPVRMLQVAEYYQSYYENYLAFLDQTFGSQSRQQPTDRLATLGQFIYQAYADDQTLYIASGKNATDFMNSLEKTIPMLTQRYVDAVQMVQTALKTVPQK